MAGRDLVDPTVAVALIVAAASSGTPLVLSWLTERSRRRDRREDFARQDEQARRTAETLRTIHLLVNSNLMSAQRRELESTRGLLAAMQEVIEVKRSLGIAVKPETLVTVSQVDTRVIELARELELRGADQRQGKAGQIMGED